MALTDEEIIKFIESDKDGDLKRYARIGQKYYDAEHDIKKYKVYYCNSDGEWLEDKTRSNRRISHPFFTEIVDQEVQYTLSVEELFKSDMPELQTELDNYFNQNENFMAELYEAMTDVVVKGSGFLYSYKNEDDTTCFQYADYLNVVQVKAKDASDNQDHVIYRYTETIPGKEKQIIRIQVWDDHQVFYYVKFENNGLVKDPDKKRNPSPHIVYHDEKEGVSYGSDYGMIPFFRMDNNRKRVSGLKPIKELIDDYDLMACGLSNNIQDASEYVAVVSGFEGDNLEELMGNIKTKKHIGVGQGGDVEFKTVDIPYEARKVKLELDEKGIYHFGMALNTATMADGSYINGVNIKSRYALLDMKCNKLVIRLKQFLRKILKPVLSEINEKNGTDYQQKDVYFGLDDREIMTNATDNAQIALYEAQTRQADINTLMSLKDTLDDETIIKKMCDVLDIDYETIKDKLPESLDGAYGALQGQLDE